MSDLRAHGVWLRVAALMLTLTVLVLGVMTARTVVEGEAELELSKVAFDRGELERAVLHARRAAILYAPGAPHVEAAYARLRAIAFGSEASGDPRTARLAWAAMRGAALETRHVFVPRASELAESERQLLRLASNAAGGGKSKARVQVELPGPKPLWAVLLSASFVLALAGLAYVGLQGVERSGKIRPKRLLLGVALTLVAVACWTASLYWA